VKLIDPLGLNWGRNEWGTFFNGLDTWNELKKGAAATADGLNPFGNPLEKYYADKNGKVDNVYKWSRDLGTASGLVAAYVMGLGAIEALDAASLAALTALAQNQALCARGVGLLNNNDILRIGWGWNGTREVFRIGIGGPKCWIWRHIDLF
jgi:hypothetical protein